ncbi:hypothetical protein ABZ904_29140 [Streptomyces sp. NPDC046900]|uniref:hypothetical protein n=1 Tax=Streptomyces sp. NPDC046900 TaxID=3155473 RepID=UPI0033F6E551
MPTLAEIRAFVGDVSEVGALVAIQEAAAARLVELDAASRPVISPGRIGRINTTIRPACLRHLTGTVGQPNRTGGRFDFVLDENSTEQLRRDPQNTRFTVSQGEKRYRIPKIPASCNELTDTPADS